MKQAWLDAATDELWLKAWHRYIMSPPETLTDALAGLEHVLDCIEGSESGLVGLRDIVASLHRDLQSNVPVPNLACRLRKVAELAFNLWEWEPDQQEMDLDCARILESVAFGIGRPRLV